MPLLEVTTRTLPLQQALRSAIQNCDARFVTDGYSVEEAKAQIELSFNNARQALAKTREVTKRLNLRTPMEIGYAFVKCLAEPIYGGRHETLRWADTLADADGSWRQGLDFLEQLERALAAKREDYAQKLCVQRGFLRINCRDIRSYWITPDFSRDLEISIEVVANSMNPTAFMDFLVSKSPKLREINIGINDMNDLYHLYSLIRGNGITEIWTCNQKFVKRHEEYLADIQAFAYLFDPKQTKIVRIK